MYCLNYYCAASSATNRKPVSPRLLTPSLIIMPCNIQNVSALYGRLVLKGLHPLDTIYVYRIYCHYEKECDPVTRKLYSHLAGE